MSLRVCTGVTGGLYWCHWGGWEGRMGSCRNCPAMAAATCGTTLEGHGAFWWLLVTAGPGNLHALGPVSPAPPGLGSLTPSRGSFRSPHFQAQQKLSRIPKGAQRGAGPAVPVSRGVGPRSVPASEPPRGVTPLLSPPRLFSSPVLSPSL